MQVFSFSPFGYEGAIVTVEVDLRRGIPAVDLVGLADNAVRESRERMRAAIRNSGFEFPCERVLISLSPADVKKEGAGFDLAIALSILAAATSYPGQFPAQDCRGILIMGELELSGRVRAVRGVHAAICTALEQGIGFCIIPAENAAEAVAGGIKTAAVETLSQAFHALQRFAQPESDAAFCGGSLSAPAAGCRFEPENDAESASNTEAAVFPPVEPYADFAAVTGQDFLVRALQIAAAGRHHLMVYGPPGCGKTLALQRFPSLLPLLLPSESRVCARIYSLAGIRTSPSGVLRPPFRLPHQSATLEGMIGGGLNCLPGEISLAHNGVLFLDEAAEFKSGVLQALRVPLETGRVTLSRAGRHTTFPADFQLLIAMNPCPCGNLGVAEKICVCSPRSVEQYWKKISAPLLDRIDIRLPLFSRPDKPLRTLQIPPAAKSAQSPPLRQAPPASQAAPTAAALSSAVLRPDIARAVNVQRRRQGKPNSRLSPEETASVCQLEKAAADFLRQAAFDCGFSARSVSICLKLARTIADMAGSPQILEHHLREAVELRKNEGGFSCFFA